ncbi:response regulator transcription factor [Lachnoclostridium sp.]|uniref:response regulator transcription factor n=1 Tax=Lachnoclostridium sp. TaxID=2028282 RepID=UPI0028978246|nr:response regulator [Lachnoclostridium sp.]
MYKLVIADDEKIIRQGLKNVVDWEKIGFEIIEIFSDGQEVIEYLEYMMPDLILTDIKMNHVSGMEVAKYVFEQQLPCKVVLISGYQEFDLALQGIKYGVMDYLLKPSNVENISKTFIKIKEELDQKHKEKEKAQADKERIDEVLPLLEDHFFSDLILGVADSEEYIKNRMNILYPEIDIEHSFCLLVDICIQDYEKFMEEIWQYNYDQFEINISNFLRIYDKDISFHLVYKSNNIIELFGIVTKQVNKEQIESLCHDSIEKLLLELKANFKFHASYQIRQIYSNIYQIRNFWEGLLKDDSDEAIQQHLQEQKKLIMSNITLGNIVTAQKIFHNVLDVLNVKPVLYRNNMVIDILSTMHTIIKEVNDKLSNSLQNYFNYSVILSFSNGDDLKSYCNRIFDRIKLAEEKKEYYDANSLISKAKTYIMENINRDISQEEVANQLFICSAYLSRLFKKQTGENFSQYVTRMKVEKAIELLKDPQYKTYQVSEALGYKTPRYFSRIFRMQTGMNPSEYRGKVLRLGEEYDEN